jgi:hypothetical protein
MTVNTIPPSAQIRKAVVNPKSFGPPMIPDILSNPIMRAEEVLYWMYPAASMKSILFMMVAMGTLKTKFCRKPPIATNSMDRHRMLMTLRVTCCLRGKFASATNSSTGNV